MEDKKLKDVTVNETFYIAWNLYILFAIFSLMATIPLWGVLGIVGLSLICLILFCVIVLIQGMFSIWCREDKLGNLNILYCLKRSPIAILISILFICFAFDGGVHDGTLGFLITSFGIILYIFSPLLSVRFLRKK